MISWFLGNLGTIVISFLLLLIVAGIILIMIRDKKKGRSCCGGNCTSCKLCSSHSSADPAEESSTKTRELRNMLASGRAAEAGKRCACCKNEKR